MNKETDLQQTAVDGIALFDGKSYNVQSSKSEHVHSLLSANVSLEEYLYYAQQQNTELPYHRDTILGKVYHLLVLDNEQVKIPRVVHEAVCEGEDARRALRQANWATVFFLITADVLGPFNAPFAFSQVGYVPGVLLYFFMGIMAFYSGLLLWRLFLQLDSSRYPVRTYADLAERIFGRPARTVCTILQSIQLLFNVGTLCLANGTALSQISKGKLCFVICILIWPLVGMIVGQIRTLKKFGWLVNFAVWINLCIIFITMGVVVRSPPNFAAATAAYGIEPGPVKTAAFVSLPLVAKANGIMSMPYAFGCVMVFPEIMAEMRRPADFLKGMAMAQLVIFSAFMSYGIIIYTFQGQFTMPLAYQGISKYAWQTVANVLFLVTGTIAAGLSGNIGIKIAYMNIVEDWFRGPPLMSSKGHVIWVIMVCLYWSLAFVLASAIPQVQTISGFIASVALIQFTFSFPPLLLFGYQMQVDAMKGDATRADRWGSWARWKRGLFTGRVLFKLFNFLVFLAAVCLSCLGMFGSGTSIKNVFEVSQATSFGCLSPV